MSKHTFTIEAEFEDAAEYESFVSAVSAHGGEVTNEESDFNG